MDSSITFSGPIDLISTIAAAAADIYNDFYGGESETQIDNISVPVVQFNPAQSNQAAAAAGVPPKAAPARKRETAAEKKARLEKEALAAAPASEPNAAANAAIQQQSQWAQQPVQTAPNFQPQGGFPAAAVNPAQPAGFPASAPAAPNVDVAGQNWLAPHAVNAAPGPSLEQLYQLINTGIAPDNAKRTLFSNWMFHKQIQDLSHIKDQPQVITEAYGIAQKIISGEIQPVA